MDRVEKLEVREKYGLWVQFTDGFSGELDLSDRLFGPVFEPLRDPQLFRQASVDEFGAVCWPTGADLAPDGLRRHLKEKSLDAIRT